MGVGKGGGYGGGALTSSENPHKMGPLTGGPQCRMSNLRNDNVPCHYFCNVHVNFKIV